MSEENSYDHLKKYLNLCKKENFDLINSISVDIKNLSDVNDIARHYDVSVEDVESINYVMNAELNLDNRGDNLQYIFQKYHLLK